MTQIEPKENLESCKTDTRKRFCLEIEPPPYDSLSDRVYRLFTGSNYAGPLRADTIQNFIQRACAAGRLSQTFHTGLPHAFIPLKVCTLKACELTRTNRNHLSSYTQEQVGLSRFLTRVLIPRLMKRLWPVLFSVEICAEVDSAMFFGKNRDAGKS